MSALPQLPVTPVKWNERFERQVIFRLARWLPLGIGGLATLALLVGACVLAYSFLPTLEPSEPKPIEAPAPVKLTLADVQLAMKNPASATSDSQAEEGDNAENADTPTPAAAPYTPSAEMTAFVKAMQGLRDQLQRKGIDYLDVTEDRCQWTNSYDGSCGEYRKEIVTHGVGDELLNFFGRYEQEPIATAQRVSFPDNSIELSASENPGLPAMTKVVTELSDIMAQSKQSNARQMLETWLNLRQQQEASQQQAHEQKVDEQQQKYNVALSKAQETRTHKQQLKSNSLMALAAALASLVFCGLVLAVIALERHTRALQASLQHFERAQRSSVPSP